MIHYNLYSLEHKIQQYCYILVAGVINYENFVEEHSLSEFVGYLNKMKV